METSLEADELFGGHPTTPGHVVIINDIAEMKGGATAIALLTAKVLRERGIGATYFTGLDPAAPMEGETVSTGSRHILDGARPASMLRGLHNGRARLMLAQWIAENDTPETIYHVHGWSKVLSPSIFGSLAPVSSRLVIHAHDFFLSCPNGGYFNFRRGHPCELRPLGAACLSTNCDRRHFSHKLWRSARLAALRRSLDLSAAGSILVVHDEMIPLLARQGVAGPNIRVLRNPIEPWTDTRVSAESNRQILFVGRLSEEKGCLLLAKAARAANVPVRFIGDGPLASRLAETYPEFAILGWRDRSEIAHLCRDARALVLPSQWRETFGIVALEAVMSGLPILIAKYALLANEIVAKGLGLTCDPLDQAGFTNALRQISDDDTMVARMSRAGVSEGRSLAPTVDAWAQSLAAHYQGVLRRSSASRHRPHGTLAARRAASLGQPLEPVDRKGGLGA